MSSPVNKKKVIITSALPYVNNVLHLGNIIGSVLSADVFARYAKARWPHDDIIFVGGVDEYGTATEMKAREAGVSYKELCDKNGLSHEEINRWFMIGFDCYGRTSQPNGNPAQVDVDWPQTKITHKIFNNLCKAKYVIEQEETCMYCPEIDSFVADRFVTGICPNCKYPKCNGDQCDDCGKLLAPEEVIDPKYKPNPEFKLEVRTTKNLYIDTDKIWQDNEMTQWFKSREGTWTNTASSITEDWLNRGLKPRSITRDLKWGTIVPNTPEFGDMYRNKVFYVWFDAPIGYISITEKQLGQEESERYWRDPETKLIQFMAKDNVQFHSVIFPVTLRGSGYSEISEVDIVSTEYLMYEGQKFSKTNNIGLFGDDVINISKKYNLCPDYWRAYLVFIRPENNDSNFVLNAEGGFVDFVNNILIKNIGNLLHRVLSLAFQIHNKHKVDTIEINGLSHEAKSLDDDCKDICDEYQSHMDKYRLSEGLKTTLKFSTRLNLYINETEPWNLIKDGTRKDELYGCMVNLYLKVIELSHILEPFMPRFSKDMGNKFKITQIGSKRAGSDLIHLSTVLTIPLEKPSVMINQLDKIDM
jgi:methionyl-tRNA synthetase